MRACVSWISSAICIFWSCSTFVEIITSFLRRTRWRLISFPSENNFKVWSGEKIKILTHQRWHFALCELRHGSTDWNLERCDVKSRHVILAATFVIVVNDVFSHIIIGSRIFDVRFTSSAVHDEYQHEYCVSDGGEKSRKKICQVYFDE